MVLFPGEVAIMSNILKSHLVPCAEACDFLACMLHFMQGRAASRAGSWMFHYLACFRYLIALLICQSLLGHQHSDAKHQPHPKKHIHRNDPSGRKSPKWAEEIANYSRHESAMPEPEANFNNVNGV